MSKNYLQWLKTTFCLIQRMIVMNVINVTMLLIVVSKNIILAFQKKLMIGNEFF